MTLILRINTDSLSARIRVIRVICVLMKYSFPQQQFQNHHCRIGYRRAGTKNSCNTRLI